METQRDTQMHSHGQRDGQTLKGPRDILLNSASLVHLVKLERLNQRFPQLIRHYVRHSVRLVARSSLLQARVGALLDGYGQEAQHISSSPEFLNQNEWIDGQRILIGCGEVICFRNMFRSLAEARPSLGKCKVTWQTPELNSTYLQSLYKQILEYTNDAGLLEQNVVLRLTALMSKIDWELKTEEAHPVLVAAWLYWHLQRVSYFPLGNSSMARLVSRLVLQIAGYGFVSYIGIEQMLSENGQIYKHSLQTNDPTMFAKLYLETLVKGGNALELDLQRRWIDGPGPPAEIRLLDLLAAYGRLTTKEAAAELSIPMRTVRRYLRQLHQAGWLKREGKRGSYLYFLDLQPIESHEQPLASPIVVGAYTILPSSWPHIEPRWQPSSPWSWPLTAHPFKVLRKSRAD